VLSIDDKVKKILEENSEIWKTESAYFSYIRGCIRLAWSKNPVKLKLLKKVKKQIPNPNYGKPRNTKLTVMGAECEICNKDFPMKEIEVDHKNGGTYSLKQVADIQGFFESICIVSEDDLRVVCKSCHGALTYAARNNISFEEAELKKKVINICKDKQLLIDTLVAIGVDSIPKTKKGQEELLYKLLLESKGE
jgi:hypothetical protein